MLTKERFCAIIRRLEAATRLQEKVRALFQESRENLENDFANSASLQISHESVVVELLKEIMHDTEDIGYFIYELDFGKKYRPGCITCDGENIDLSSAEKLYDYLVKNYEQTQYI